MNEKIEGTIVLDGLIEGRFSQEESREKLEEWVKFVGSSLGLRFSLDASGDAFSLLPDNQPASTQKMGADPQDALRQAVEQLVEALPASDRGNVFSTLRSAEVRKGEEVQSVYVINQDGSVGVESRSVEAKTVTPEPPLTMKERIKFGAFGLLIAAVIFGILMLIPPVRQKFSEMLTTAAPVEAADVTIDAALYEKWFTVEVKDASRTAVVLTLTRTDAFPEDEAALDKLYGQATSMREKLAIEALARGYLRVELYADEGALYALTELQLLPLLKKESADVRMPIGDGKQKIKVIRFRL